VEELGLSAEAKVVGYFHHQGEGEQLHDQVGFLKRELEHEREYDN